MNYKNTKTILFASLIAAMILPFSGMNVYADEVSIEPIVEPAATTPFEPTNLVATPGDGQVALSWDAPTDGGTPLTDYKIKYFGGDPRVWNTEQTGNGTITSYTITGLTNGERYVILVSAQNEIGSSTPARIGSVPNAIGELTAPDAPVGLIANATGSEVILSWTVPFDGGSKIIKYEIRYFDKLAGTWSWITAVDDTVTSYTYDGLTDASEYFFVVFAKNMIGSSVPATAHAYTTP